MIINSAGRFLVFFASIWVLVQLRNVLDRKHQFARQDSLTHLSNRRDFFSRGRQALAQAQRDGAPINDPCPCR
ncbi:GGDEF domain-containing protein [Propionivibrio sp.]|uniref:GGDEF domain-containing protein n=1 Tax=Propionivibrio sp. TaxID=2212460 RepID=UPI0026023BAD|nr:GGDEF domain-containing protein [Propionivibrio sp.]